MAVVLWFYALPGGITYLVVLDALVLVVSAVTVWALVSNRPPEQVDRAGPANSLRVGG